MALSPKSKTLKSNNKVPLKPFILGVCGSSGSGKSTFVNQLTQNLDSKYYVVLEQDNYYKDLSHLPLHQRAKTNFDHPDSLDLETFEKDLKSLRLARSIQTPQYNFSKHTRLPQGLEVEPKPIIIVLGILLFTHPKIVSQLDLKVYIETDTDVCLARRVQRDIAERGRTVDEVLKQYVATVKPMFEQFVAPSKKHADVIIPFDQKNASAIQLINSYITQKIKST